MADVKKHQINTEMGMLQIIALALSAYWPIYHIDN